jgi:hypothetical protein
LARVFQSRVKKKNITLISCTKNTTIAMEGNLELCLFVLMICLSSRLACQIKLGPEHNNATFALPPPVLPL